MAITEVLISTDDNDFQVTVDGFVGTTTTTSTVSTSTVTTTTQTLNTTTGSSTTQAPASTDPPEDTLHPPRMPQANPTIDKISLLLNLAGSSEFSPILSGLAGAAIIGLEDGEEIEGIRVVGDSGSSFAKSLSWVLRDDGTASTSLVFGQDTDVSTLGARNHLEVTTNYGIWRRQFWVKRLPDFGSLYIANQEAQASQARFRIREGEPISFSINIMPDFADEFFREHEFEGDRFANTLRSWGGAETAEVSLDGSVIISERNIALLNGYYWKSPSIGEHTIVVRVRASRASGYRVDITGGILVTSDVDPEGDT